MTRKSYFVIAACVVGVCLWCLPAPAQGVRIAPPGGDPRDLPQDTLNGGPTCATPTSIPMLPYVDTGNSCAGGNDIMDYNNLGVGGDCNTVMYPGPDLVYRIELFGGNQLDVTLTPTAPADMGVFLIADCTDGISCVGFEDAIGGGAISSITFAQDQLPPGEYFIYVDSYYTSGSRSCGNYQLTVDGDVPAELLDFSVE